ncbi:hypothetical protein OH77DRAFT_1405893 [Trametes cingulata]|nr:hypothetical protein OH77DRAFT_1405893 [Trametes cingulata]
MRSRRAGIHGCADGTSGTTLSVSAFISSTLLADAASACIQRDEDFDFSYEGLLSLSSLLGDAKPRGTPDDIIASLPRGTYSEWARAGATEERCPICLDDYMASDACLRVSACSHWFHEGCLQVCTDSRNDRRFT